MEEKITDRTKAVLVVHLYGQASDMGAIMEIAKKYRLKVVEDCAQSHGAEFCGKKTGTFGDISCFSFYPSKNLGAFGDGGAIVTNDSAVAENVRIFRNYGSERKYFNKVVGVNSRLDELQAGLLRIKLNHLDELQEERKVLCGRYLNEIHNKYIELPDVKKGASHVWHQFVIRCGERQKLIDHLNMLHIGTAIHYPIPPHLSEAYQYLGICRGCLPVTEAYADSVLSIPLYNGMKKEEQDYVISGINEFRL